MMKLQLTLPAMVLDLCQQLSNQDVMQFSASSPSDGQLNAMLQRLDHHIVISIDGCKEDMLQDVSDGLCCIVKGITSHVLLTPASSTDLTAEGADKDLFYSSEAIPQDAVNDVREMTGDEQGQPVDVPSADLDLTTAVMVDNLGMAMTSHHQVEEGAMALQTDGYTESDMVVGSTEIPLVEEEENGMDDIKQESITVAECIGIPLVSEADVVKLVNDACEVHCDQVEAEAVLLQMATAAVEQCGVQQTIDGSIIEVPHMVESEISSDMVAEAAQQAAVEAAFTQVVSEETGAENLDLAQFTVKSDQPHVIYIDNNGSQTDTMQTIVLDSLNREQWKSILQPLANQSEYTSNVDFVMPEPEKKNSEIARAKDRQSRRNPDGELFECLICSNGYQVLSSLHKHLRVVHHSHPQYEMAMKNIAEVRWDRLRRKSAMMLPCALCGYNCHGHELFRHMQEVHSDLPDFDAQLAAARKVYNYKARRFYPRSAPKRHQCSHGCGKSFLKGYLSLHEMKCCGPKPAEDSEESRVCKSCDKRFDSRNRFLDHMRRVHRMKANNSYITGHTCPICNRNFAIRAKLKYHMRVVHTEERNHACGVCGRTYKDAYAVRYHHRIVHLGEHRYSCDKCGRHFEKVTRLQAHICTADTDGTGVEVDPVGDATEGVICTLCGDSFRLKTDLNDHKRIAHHVYTQAKPAMNFVCEECGFWFSTRAELKAHLYLHSDDRQHLCEVCGMRFKNKNTMKQHHNTQHLNIYKFSCDVCKRLFDKRIHLHRHSCQPRLHRSFRYKTEDTKVMTKWQAGEPVSDISKEEEGNEGQPCLEAVQTEQVHVLPGGDVGEQKVCEQVLVTCVAAGRDTPDEKGDGSILVRFQPVDGGAMKTEDVPSKTTAIKYEPEMGSTVPETKAQIVKVKVVASAVSTPRTSYRLKLKKDVRNAKDQLSDS